MNIMKEAHKLAKEIKKEFPEIDYMAQLGICISYLSNKKEDVKMLEMKGTDKQVQYANDLVKVIAENVNKANTTLCDEEDKEILKEMCKLFNNAEDILYYEDEIKSMNSDNARNISATVELIANDGKFRKIRKQAKKNLGL